MSERRNEWASPGVLIGALGLFGAGVSAYTSLNGRVTSLEASGPQMERRLQRMEDKVDFLVGQVAQMNAGKAEK